jgi:hypothetical protein
VQQAIAANPVTHATKLTDFLGRPAGSRPGYVYAQDSNEKDAARAAHAALKARLADAWRSPHAASVSDQRPVTPDDIEAAREARKTQLSNAWRTTGVGFGPGSFGGST